jgi:AcrR family transcriptional regulator
MQVARRNRKADIVRCFAGLVAERGYDAVSLRDVAETLEMSKGTILHHFRSKDRLLEQVHSDYMRRRLAEAHTFLAELASPTDQVRALVYQLIYAQAQDRAATVAFAREIARFASEEVMADVRRMRDEYTELISPGRRLERRRDRRELLRRPSPRAGSEPPGTARSGGARSGARDDAARPGVIRPSSGRR